MPSKKKSESTTSAIIEEVIASRKAEENLSVLSKLLPYAPVKPSAIPTIKTRTAIQGVAMGVQFSAMLLASKDADNEGWDDYFAFKLNQISGEMQHFAATGKLPTDSE